MTVQELIDKLLRRDLSLEVMAENQGHRGYPPHEMNHVNLVIDSDGKYIVIS